MIHHDFITQKLFNDFVRNHVLSLTTRAKEEDLNSMLCLDNVFAHKSQKLQNMCDEVDVILTFLLLYFCDFNFIETFFAMLKK